MASVNPGTALKNLEDLNPLEWVFRAITGTTSPVYDAAQNLELRKSVADAGGGAAAQAKAVEEQSSIQSLFGAQSPISSLVNTIKGNASGVAGASTDWVSVVIVLVVVAGGFYLLNTIFKKVL